MLLRKMLRDMGRHKAQFLSIFLMAFLAVFIYTGVGGEWHGLKKSAEDFYAAQNMADAFLYGESFDDEAKASILSLPGVREVERRLALDTVAKMDGDPSIAVYFLEDCQISRPYSVAGREMDAQSDGLWIGQRFADARGIAIGDPITLSFRGQEFTKTVEGIVYSPEHVYMAEADTLSPDFSMTGYVFLSKNAFPIPQLLSYNTLLLTVNQPDAALEERIDAALDGQYALFLARENHPSVLMFENEITQHHMMGDVFPVVFLLIALLTILTTMTRILSAQRLQIGTLQALGFSKAVITRHYLSYGFWLSLAGAATGCITGPLTLPHFFYPSMSRIYTLPRWLPAFDVSFIVAGALVVLLCTAVTWLTCRRLLRGMPAQTLRPKAPQAFRHGALTRTRLFRALGFNAQWNLRDASRNRARSLMAIIGALGCTALLVCAFGLNRCMTELKKWQYEDIFQFTSRINLSETVTNAQMDEIIEAADGEALMEGAIELRFKDKKRNGTITVLDEARLIVPTDVRLKPLAIPRDGVSLSAKMANILGARQGDTIRWRLYGDESWIESPIAAIHRDPTSQGLLLHRAHFEDLGRTFAPTAILSAQPVTGPLAGAASVASTADIIAGWDDLTEALNMLVYLLILAAVVLSVVVLYNLGLLSFTEMERELATLKVLGLKSRKIRNLLLTQNLWFSAIGYVLGLPCGIALVLAITSTSGETFDFPVSLHFSTAQLAFLITIGLSIAVNLLFSGKIRRLDMVESLKAME